MNSSSQFDQSGINSNSQAHLSGYINEKTQSDILNTSKATGTISSRIESKS